MTDDYYGTALTIAVCFYDAEVVSLLLDRGADIQTSLVEAAYRGEGTVVPLLLDRGANINAVSGEYGTALAAAASQGKQEIVSLLLGRGAGINTVGGGYGTALAAALNLNQTNASLLLDRGADIQISLVEAAYRGDLWSMELILNQADINGVARGRYGTALTAAASQGKEWIVSLLLDRGAHINTAAGEYGTALAAATLQGEQQIVSLLLDRGADINTVAGKYGTALAAAAIRGKTDMVSLLLQHGADVVRAGGSYSTTLGVYPSVLDAAHSEGSEAGESLLALLKTATPPQNGPQTNAGPVENALSRPPFPLPYVPPSLTSHASPIPYMPPNLSSPDITSTKFPAGGNITPEHAGIPCQKINEEVLWQSLTALVGLHQNTIQARCQWIRNDVRYFLTCNFEFGLAYAAARIAWKDFNDHSVDSRVISRQRGLWHKHSQMLKKVQSKAIQTDSSASEQELIIEPYSVMPRRLWDLKSNRTINFQVLHAAQSNIDNPPTFWAVSHSWTSDMSPTWTAVNHHEWPIPLPESITLDKLRSELLTLGAEYVWIDVVCLRQQSSDHYFEQLRKEDWRLDVPTIGNIYRAAAKIVRYFNGLGVCFSNDGWDDSRHWLQRAWTLQEIAAESATINGGIKRERGQIFLNSEGKISGKVTKLRNAIRPVTKLATQVRSQYGCEVYELAREMSKRHASQPVDKISGLFYLLHTTKLPCYDEQMTSEAFWQQCFHLLPVQRKVEILFDFPYRGSDKQWFPTWVQLLDWPVRDLDFEHIRSQSRSTQNLKEETLFFLCSLWTVPDAVLEETDSPGVYEFNIGNRLFSFYVPYVSQKPINVRDQSAFTLATAIPDPEDAHAYAYNWLVCEAIGKRAGTEFGLVGVAEVNVLKKVGVIRTDECSELLVGGENGGSLLKQVHCLFV